MDKKSKITVKKGGKMELGMIKSAIDLVKELAHLSSKAIEAGDPEKYADSVEKLHKGVDDSYALMRRIVTDDEKLTTDEKLEKLRQIAEEEEKTKQRFGDQLEEHREKTGRIALDVLQGFMTCGLSFAPAIVKRIKAAIEGKDEELPLPADIGGDDLLPAEETPDEIEEPVAAAKN